MKQQLKKWSKFTLRWGIAVIGIWYVLAGTSFHDRIMILGKGNVPDEIRIIDGAGESDSKFTRADGKGTIHALGTSQEGTNLPVTSVELLGSSEKVTWRQTADALEVALPSGASCKYAYSLKLTARK